LLVLQGLPLSCFFDHLVIRFQCRFSVSIRFRSARVRVELSSPQKVRHGGRRAVGVSHQRHSIEPGEFTLDLYRLVCMVCSRQADREPTHKQSPRALKFTTDASRSSTPRGIKLLKSRCGWHLYGIPALAAVRLGTFASMITRDMIRWQYSLQTLPR
jgi:hypothetical protein